MEKVKLMKPDLNSSIYLRLMRNKDLYKKPPKEKEITADEYEIVYNRVTDKNHPYERWRRNKTLRLFLTTEVARYLDRRTFLTVAFIEGIIYSMFIMVLFVIASQTTPQDDMFHFSKTMSTLYINQPFISDGVEKTFYEINSPIDIFNYLINIIDKILYSFWYSPSDPFDIHHHSKEPLYENKLIGAAQLRQKRVVNGSCVVDKDMAFLVGNCYGPYSAQFEDKAPSKTSASFTYSTDNQTKSSPINGILTTYGKGGYQIILPGSKEAAIQQILQLKANRWIDAGTRAIFIEFALYNENINLFCIFKLIFELPSTGGVLPSKRNIIQKLLRYNDANDVLIFLYEIVFLLFGMYFTIQKILEFSILKMKLFKSFWSWIDLVIILMCYQVTAANFLQIYKMEEIIPDIMDPKNEKEYISLDEIYNLNVLFNTYFIILIIFASLKTTKYLIVIRAWYQLHFTFCRALYDILLYCITFFYMFLVFAFLGFVLFGDKLENYRTFPLAVFALLRSAVGDFNYNCFVQADGFMGPLFFFAYLFIIPFVLVSMFYAILLHKYEETRSELRSGRARTFIGDLIREWCIRLLEILECDWLLAKIEHKRLARMNHSLTEAIRHYLKEAGYSALEIELFFINYDIHDSQPANADGDQQLSQSASEISKSPSQSQLSYKGDEREVILPLAQKDILRYIINKKLEYLERHTEAADKLIGKLLKKLTRFDTKKTK